MNNRTDATHYYNFFSDTYALIEGGYHIYVIPAA